MKALCDADGAARRPDRDRPRHAQQPRRRGPPGCARTGRPAGPRASVVAAGQGRELALGQRRHALAPPRPRDALPPAAGRPAALARGPGSDPRGRRHRPPVVGLDPAGPPAAAAQPAGPHRRHLPRRDVAVVPRASPRTRRPSGATGSASRAARSRHEARMVAALDEVVVFSDKDVELLGTPAAHARRTPSARATARWCATGPPPGHGAVLVVSYLARDENNKAALWTVGELWPRVSPRCPGARLRLVGGGATDELRRAAERGRVGRAGRLRRRPRGGVRRRGRRAGAGAAGRRGEVQDDRGAAARRPDGDDHASAPRGSGRTTSSPRSPTARTRSPRRWRRARRPCRRPGARRPLAGLGAAEFARAALRRAGARVLGDRPTG